MSSAEDGDEHNNGDSSDRKDPTSELETDEMASERINMIVEEYFKKGIN